MPKSQQSKQLLSMAGEFGVASELMKRGIFATITYGNAKAVDIYVLDSINSNYKRIEVKTSSTTKFVTNFFQKYISPNTPHPDFWILVHIDKQFISHFYILTHDEMAKVQMHRNGMTAWGAVKGVDNVLLPHIKDYEDKWDKISLHHID